MQTTNDLDLELIFSLGLEQEPRCEHGQHQQLLDTWHADGELIYVRVTGCQDGRVMFYCKKFLDLVEECNPPCALCGGDLIDHYEIIGPSLP